MIIHHMGVGDFFFIRMKKEIRNVGSRSSSIPDCFDRVRVDFEMPESFTMARKEFQLALGGSTVTRRKLPQDKYKIYYLLTRFKLSYVSAFSRASHARLGSLTPVAHEFTDSVDFREAYKNETVLTL